MIEYYVDYDRIFVDYNVIFWIIYDFIKWLYSSFYFCPYHYIYMCVKGVWSGVQVYKKKVRKKNYVVSAKKKKRQWVSILYLFLSSDLVHPQT